MTAIAISSEAQDDVSAVRVAQQGAMRIGWIVIGAKIFNQSLTRGSDEVANGCVTNSLS
jgi:hypothetical protein